MVSWPNVQLPSGMKESTEDLAIRSQMESGIVQTRPRFTRSRRKWQLSWEYMRGADYRSLRSFYSQMRGGATSFSWSHPTEGTAFNVRFSSEIDSDNQSFDFWSVNVSIEQV